MTLDFRDNETLHRFELVEQGLTAFANYRRVDGHVTIPHVEAPLALRGKGTASRLMQAIVDEARAKKFKMLPTCPYARVWFQRHAEAADVLA
jgi:predicted GNAT family acetyltransferase